MRHEHRAGIVISYGYIAINTLIGLFMSAYVLRQLGKTDYGVYQTMTSFANYLILLNFGTGTVMTRNLSMALVQKDQVCEHKTMSTVSIVSAALSVVIMVAITIFYSLLDTIYDRSLNPEQLHTGKILFILVSANIVVTLWNQTVDGIIQSHEKFIFSKSILLIKLLLRTVLLIVLLASVKTALIIVIVDLILSVLMLGVSIIYSLRWCSILDYWRLKNFDWSIFRESLPLAYALFLQTIINQANGNVDKFCIGIMLTPDAVSIYSVGMYIYIMYSSVATVPISIYLPKTVQMYAKGMSIREMSEMLIAPSRVLVATSGAICFGFFAFGRQFIQLVYGMEYIEAWGIASVILIPMFINMANGILVNILDATGKRLVRSLILIGTTAINIGLTIVFLKVMGLIGAAIATAIATAIGQIIVMNIYYSRALGIQVVRMLKEVLRGILPALFISSGISAVMAVYLPLGVGTFLLISFSFMILYMIQLILYGLNQNEKNFILNQFNKLRKRFIGDV